MRPQFSPPAHSSRSPYTVLWWLVTGPLLACGAVLGLLGTTPGVTIGLSLVTALTCAVMGWMAQDDRTEGAPPVDRRAVSRVAGAGVVVVLALVGLGLVGPSAVLALIGLLVLSPRSVAWARGRLTTAPTSAEVPGSPSPLLPRAAGLSTDELCRAWLASFDVVTTATAAREPALAAEVAELRHDYLEELERRDAAGFERWMESGARPGSDPRRFLRAEPEAGLPPAA